MANDFIIDIYSLKKFKVGANEYEISVFIKDSFKFSFHVSLQDNNNDLVLWTYQLVNKNLDVPLCIIERMKDISDWILSDEKKTKP